MTSKTAKDLFPKAQDSRKLVWVTENKPAAWGCSECSWTFSPVPIAVNSFDLMTAHLQEKLDTDFSSHDCAQNLTAKTPILVPTISKLRKAPRPPLSRPGSVRDADRAKPPTLSEPDNREEKEPGDRVEALGLFGKATGQIGTVKKTNEDDAVVKWDDDGRTRRLQSSLKKV
jgi:hypothetical protein